LPPAIIPCSGILFLDIDEYSERPAFHYTQSAGPCEARGRHAAAGLNPDHTRRD